MTQANEKYTGVFIFNKLASKDIDGKRNGNAYKESEEIIMVEGAVPAIISKEEFDTAQKIILSRKQVRAANNAVEVYLLSGKIFCGECECAYVGNRKFAGRNKTLQVTYRCSVRKNKHICSNKDIRKDYIDITLKNLSWRNLLNMFEVCRNGYSIPNMQIRKKPKLFFGVYLTYGCLKV